MSAGWEGLGRPAVKSYGQRDGLPHHTVHTISRDRLGRIWVGTQEGAACYDGRRWVPVPMPPGSPSQFVRSIAEDPDGSRWFATQGAGIWRQQGEQWEQHTEAQGLPSLRVHHLLRLPTAEATLWAATDLGPARSRGGSWQVIKEGLPNPWVWKLAWVRVPGLGPTLVACTQGGLYALAGDRWVLPPAFHSLAGAELNDALEVPGDQGGVLWVSVWGKGPARWDGQGWVFPRPGEGFPGRYSTCLAWSLDPKGGTLLWVGTYENGLAYLRQGQWQVLSADRGLRSNGVYAVWPDPRGRPTVWLGMQGGGITALSLQGWVALLDRQSGLPSSSVNCLLETRDPQGGILFGTTKGLASWSRGTWRTQDTRNGLPDSDIRALAEVTTGSRHLLFAGTSRGLARWDGRVWLRDPGLPAEEVNVLLASRQGGRLFAGLRSGLYVLEEGSWKHLQPDSGSPEPLSLAETAEGPEGSLWVGTRGAGLWRLRAKHWERLDPQPQYPRQWFTALKALPGPGGEPWLWVGTRGNGLLRAGLGPEQPRWQVYGAPGEVALPHTVVLRIEQDARHRLYLGTSGGVERLQFDPDGHTLQRTETFTTGDGLPATGSNQGASLVDGRGRIWFGFSGGAAFLDPREEAAEQPLPSPVLARALIAGQDRRIDQGLDLGHRENHLSLDFFVPVFFREEDLRFRSQLEGAETQPGPWRYEGFREYSGLAPGHYRLKVWVRNHAGQISEPFSLPIHIAPAVWASPAAVVAYVLLVLGVGVLVVKVRTRTLRHRELWLRARVDEATSALKDREQRLQKLADELSCRNDEKNQILGILAHDLRNPLTAIQLQAELLVGGEQPEQRPGALRISRSVQSLLELLERLLDVNRIDSGTTLGPLVPLDLHPVVQALAVRHQANALAKGLDLVVASAPNLPQVCADVETLDAILDNLLSNAVKFSPTAPPNRSIRVGFAVAEVEVAIWVQDEGLGFNPEELPRAFDRFTRLSARPTAGESSTGLGLSIVKKLTEAMGGRVELESRRGEGSTFTVWLPRVDGKP